MSYTANAWTGEKFDRDLDITDIAKLVRKYVRATLPGTKWSVRVERYSGGQSLHVTLVSAPLEAILCDYTTEWVDGVQKQVELDSTSGHLQVNEYSLRDEFGEGLNNGCKITKDVWQVLRNVASFISGYNYDDSDSMIDYFDTNFYMHLNIGSWDKPYVNTLQALAA